MQKPKPQKIQQLPAEQQALNYGLGDLHPREIDLIKKIRSTYRFGEITLVTADGLPKQILKTVSRDLMQDAYPV